MTVSLGSIRKASTPLLGASPELGLWAGTQTRRIRPQTPAHVSAGEESAREPTSVIHFLGTQGISLRVWLRRAKKGLLWQSSG